MKPSLLRAAMLVSLSVTALAWVPWSASASAPPPTKGMPRLSTGLAGTAGHDEPTDTSCQPDSCYYYVYGYQNASASGASATIDQAEPIVAASDYHSLAEMAVESGNGQDIVEFGWNVDPGVNGDSTPHLFVFHWINGTATCYDGCGFVAIKNSAFQAGSPVKVGGKVSYQINFKNNQWQISYGKTEIGYFPEKLWDGTFKAAGLTQIFGEVSSRSSSAPATQMGNGILGSKTGSISFSAFKLLGSSAKPDLSVQSTLPHLYDAGAVTATGFRFGGPGA